MTQIGCLHGTPSSKSCSKCLGLETSQPQAEKETDLDQLKKQYNKWSEEHYMDRDDSWVHLAMEALDQLKLENERLRDGLDKLIYLIEDIPQDCNRVPPIKFIQQLLEPKKG